MKIPVPIGKSYVFFALGITAVAGLTSLNVTCPIDAGTGTIKGAAGLIATDVEYTLDYFETFDTGCAEIYTDFSYSVNVTLANNFSSTRAGAVLIKFYDPSAVKSAADLATVIAQREEDMEMPDTAVITEEVGKGGQIVTFRAPPTASKFLFVELPAGTSTTIEEKIDFRGFGREEAAQFGLAGVTHVVSVAPPVEAITCPYSNGTGKVPLTEWIRLKAGI